MLVETFFYKFQPPQNRKKISRIKTWPQACENQTKPVWRLSWVILSLWPATMSLARDTNSRKLPNRETW